MNLTSKELAEQWFVPEQSNISIYIYGNFGQNVIDHHESIRQRFRLYCNLKLGINYDINSLINFYGKIHNKEIIPESAFIDITETEFILLELFQSEILKLNQEDINEKRFRWSFKNYLKFNDGFMNKEYKGTYIKYLEWYGK